MCRVDLMLCFSRRETIQQEPCSSWNLPVIQSSPHDRLNTSASLCVLSSASIALASCQRGSHDSRRRRRSHILRVGSGRSSTEAVKSKGMLAGSNLLSQVSPNQGRSLQHIPHNAREFTTDTEPFGGIPRQTQGHVVVRHFRDWLLCCNAYKLGRPAAS